MPEAFVHKRVKMLCLFFVGLAVPADESCHFRHGAVGGNIEYLLGTHGPVLIDVRPVHEDPVSVFFDKEAVTVLARCAKIHQRFASIEDEADKIKIAVVLVIFECAEDKIKTVVRDRVDMLGDGILAAHADQGAAHDVLIMEKICVEFEGLVGVTAPEPAVALDRLGEDLARVDMQGVAAHIVNAVDALVVTSEVTAVGKRQIFIIRFDPRLFCAENINVTEGAGAKLVFLFSLNILPNDRVLDVQCLLHGFTVADVDLLIGPDIAYIQIAVELLAEIKERSLAASLTCDGKHSFVRKKEARGELFLCIVHLAVAHGDFFISLVQRIEITVCHNLLALNIGGGKAFEIQAADVQMVFAFFERNGHARAVALCKRGIKRRNVQHGAVREFLLPEVNEYVARAIQMQGKGRILRYGDIRVEVHLRLNGVYAPDHGIVHPEFLAAGIDEIGVKDLVVALIINPIAFFHNTLRF